MWTVVKAWQQAYIIYGLEMDRRIHLITCNGLTSLTNIHADTQTGISAALEMETVRTAVEPPYNGHRWAVPETSRSCN